MATYHYGCKECGHDFEALQQSPKNPQKRCPECGKDTLEILIDAVPAVRGADHYTKGGRNALIYRDLNRKYKKKASFVNRQIQKEAGQ